MKLRRVYEQAEEEGKPVEDVALERYGSLEAFEEAKEERRIIDEREGRRGSRGKDRERCRESDRKPRGGGGDRDQERYMFNNTGSSGGSTRSSSFRRPGESAPSTPSPNQGYSGAPLTGNKRVDALRAPPKGSPLSLSHTPVPTVMTPPAPASLSGRRPLNTEELNRLQAKALRARLMGSPDAEKLQKEYEEEQRRATGGYVGESDDKDDEGGRRGSSTRTRVEVLPTLDVRGRLYDVGSGKDDGQPSTTASGNRKKKEEKFETRDPKTGELVRYNADDDDLTLGEMLRQERFGAGMADQKNLDAELAAAITRDGKFQEDLEYMDDNAERLGRKKMRSDAMKRQFAINGNVFLNSIFLFCFYFGFGFITWDDCDTGTGTEIACIGFPLDYKKTQKVLASCQFCYGEDDSPPKAPVIAMATRCYLSCTLNQELVDGHCLIVPIQHHLTTLEGDDDLWDEIRVSRDIIITYDY